MKLLCNYPHNETSRFALDAHAGRMQPPLESMEQVRRETERGDNAAEYTLASRYARGEGVPPDPILAAKWHLKAAERGYPQAQYQLGLCYYEGKGVRRNYSQAVRWFRKAAMQGHEDARYAYPRVLTL